MNLIVIAFVFAQINAASLWVVSPAVLADQFLENGEIQAHLGTFGHINYGHIVFGKLHYPDTNSNGCRPFRMSDFVTDPLFDTKNDMKPIVLLNHGNCTHAVQVMNAQRFGLKGVLLI